MSRPPFGDPGGCPTIALFSSTTNHSPFGGFFSTAWTRLSQTLISLLCALEHPTSNIERPTSNDYPACCPWIFEVGCWMSDVGSNTPLPGLWRRLLAAHAPAIPSAG